MTNDIKGTTGNETLLGTKGDDVFYASGGTDKVWGGTGGNDTLVLSGELSNYSVLDNGNGSYTIKDLRDDAPDGEIVVRAIDTFKTTDGSYDIKEMLAKTVHVVTGTQKDETLLGTDRNDVFYASGGNDRIWGGTGGDDSVVFTGNMSDYAIKDNGNGSYTITDLRDGAPDGEMVVRDIENFEFSNQTADLEEFLANSFNDVHGTDTDDMLIGSIGDDRFYGGAGDDTIWGHHEGQDVAVYTGNMEDYKVYSYGDGRYIIKDTREGAQNDGQDIIRDIEQLQFADQTVSLESFLDHQPIVPIYGSEGTQNDDVLIGSDKDDIMQAFGGNDRIWAGHEGDDTVIFTGNFSQYIITDNDNGAFTVQDMRFGSPDGTNVVRGFEHFQFADQTIGADKVIHGNDDMGNTLAGTAADDNFDGAHTNGLFDAHTNDVLDGSMGDDEIHGGPGDDIIYGDTNSSGTKSSEPVVYKDVDSDLPVFEFGSGLYQVINGHIKELDPTTGSYEDLGEDHSNFNAIGMNMEDGYAYGIGSNRTEFSGHLIRVGSDGNIETVGTGFRSVAAGTFGGDGRLYVRLDKDTLQAIDVQTLETENFDFTGGNAASVYDLVYIENDAGEGNFYGLNKYGQLTVFDMESQTMSIHSVEGIDVTGAFGAGWAADGSLYFSHNNTGNIYGITGIDTKSPTAGLLSVGSKSSINDGFSFEEADLPDEFLVEGGDFLIGGHGNDTLIGGGGNDRLNGGVGADTLQGGEGLDSADYTHAAEGVVVDLAEGGLKGEAEGDRYESIERVDGSDHDDVISGDDADNWLVGNDGDDELFGFGGNDTIRGGADADVINGGEGHDTASYYYSEDGVSVNLETNVNIGGDAQGDMIYEVEQVQGSRTGDDSLTGSANNDILQGFGGNDRLDGGAGDDDVRGGTGTDTIYGGSGNDFLIGQEGNDMIYGGADDDNVQGGQGDDMLSGGSGSDRLWAAEGNDVLNGGVGDDFMRGGDGNDTFVFGENSGNDTIFDFSAGTDQLDFSALSHISSMDDLTIEEVTDTQSVIRYDDGVNTVELAVESYGDLTLHEHDFIF